MVTIHTAVWSDSALSVPGNHALGLQPAAGVTLAQVEGWLAWTGTTNDFLNAGTPGSLARICGIRAVPTGNAPGRLKDNLNDPNLLLGPSSMDVSQQPFWSDQPTSTGAWSHFTSTHHYLWRGARYFPAAMDWYAMMDYIFSPPTTDAVTSGELRFVFW